MNVTEDAKAGDDVLFTCSVTDDAVQFVTSMTVEWRKLALSGTEPLHVDTEVRRVYRHELTNVQGADAGVYVCAVMVTYNYTTTDDEKSTSTLLSINGE